MAEKQYCGKGKIGKFADTFRVGLRADQLPQPNAGGYINLIMAKMKQPDKMGNEYTLYVDDFQPGNKGNEKPEPSGTFPF